MVGVRDFVKDVMPLDAARMARDEAWMLWERSAAATVAAVAEILNEIQMQYLLDSELSTSLEQHCMDI